MAMDITLIESVNKIMITICMIDNDNDQIIKKKWLSNYYQMTIKV